MCVGDYADTVFVSNEYVKNAKQTRVWNHCSGIWESGATHIAYVRGYGHFEGRNASVGMINRADKQPPNVRLYETGRVMIIRPVSQGEELLMRYGKGYVICKE